MKGNASLGTKKNYAERHVTPVGYPHAMVYRKRLLIAEDCEFFAKVCQALLDRDFEIVGIVNNRKQLLAMASFLKPDIVLADIHLPLMSGFEVGKK